MPFFTLKIRQIAWCAAAAFIALAALALATPRTAAQTAGEGRIEGRVVDGTKDAQLSAADGLTVTLHMATMGATATVSQTARSDAGGRFAFSNLETITTTRYLLVANYAGVDYFSDVLSFSPSQTTLPVSMTVYETTTDPSAVRVTQTHFVFDVQTRLFNILQIIAVQNNTDRTYIGASSAGPHRLTLTLPLLPGAQNVQFDNPEADDTTLRGETAMTYTLPFVPGMDQIVYNYSVPYSPPTYDFNVKLDFDTDRFRILFSDVGATLAGPQLSAASPFPTQSGQKFLLSSADNLKAGTTVSATFSNLPATVAASPSSATSPAVSPAPSTGPSQLQLIGGLVLGVAALAAIGLLLYPLLRSRRPRRAARPASDDRRRLDLLQEMADLDDAFEAHTLPEAEYKARRSAAKAKLLELAPRTGSPAGPTQDPTEGPGDGE